MAQVVHDIHSAGLLTQVSDVKSGNGVRISLARLNAMLKCIAEGSETTDSSRTSATREQILSEVLARLAPALQSYIETDPAKAKALLEGLRPMLEQYTEGDEGAANRLAETLRPVMDRYLAVNPEGFTTLLEALSPLMRQAGGKVAQNLDIARQAFANFTEGAKGIDAATFASVMSEKVAPMFAHVRGALLGNDQGSENTGRVATPANLTASLGTAVLFVQEFQVAIAKSQAKQDQATQAIGTAQVLHAQSAQQSLDVKLDQLSKELAAASDRPWWEWVVIGVAAILGAVLAALTAGAGAAIAAVAVSAFMASPLFTKCETALSGVIAKSLEDAGMSPQEAGAIGNIIAKVVITVAVVVVSAGAGGFTNVAADEAADTVVTATVTDAAEAGGEEAIEGGAQDVANNAGIGKPKLTWKAGNAAKIGTLNGVTTLAASDIWMDCLMVNPTWYKKNQTLATIINVVAELVTIMIAAVAGKICLGGMMQAGSMLENSPALLRGALVMGGAAQAGEGFTEAGFAIQGAKQLQAAADTTKESGQLQAELERVMNIIQMASTAANRIDSTFTGVIQDAGSDMNALEKASGSVWDVTSRQLADQ